MRRVSWLCALAAILIVVTAAAAFAQALNPTPTRESKLIFSFEDDKLDGWTSDPKATGTSIASWNTDPKYVSDGKGSLKLDLSNGGANDIGGWVEPMFSVDIPDGVDLKDYAVFSMDVYVPAESLFPDQPGGWFQILPRITSAGGTGYYGNRDVHAGWNRLIWDMQVGRTENVTKITAASNTDGARPWTGPIYIDNVRAYKSFTGMQPDETLIYGFDKESDLSSFTPGDGVTLAFNSDKQYISQGDGSLSVDLTGMSGWHGGMARVPLPDVDLSKATAIHLDVYVPNGNQPSDWSQIGMEITGAGGQVSTATLGFLTDQWNTLELPLTPSDAAKLADTTAFSIRVNSGAAWTGPFYIDALRAVIPAPAPSVVKGDLSGDGKLAINDVTLALQMAVGLRTPTADQLKAGDLNGDGKIDIAEVTKILKAAVGLGTL